MKYDMTGILFKNYFLYDKFLKSVLNSGHFLVDLDYIIIVLFYVVL